MTSTHTSPVNPVADPRDSFAAIEQSWGFAPSAFACISDAILIVKPTGAISFCNSAASELFGLSQSQMLSSTISTVLRRYGSLETSEAIWLQVRKCFDTGATATFVTSANDNQSLGSRSVATVSVLPPPSSQSSIDAVGVILDTTTNLRHDNARLSWLANHDALTSVFNRREMICRIERLLLAKKHAHKSGALLFIDLDHFKSINDIGGHGAGDAMLRLVANSLAKTIRETDSIARVGGDEFVILLENCPVQEAIRFCESVLGLIEEIRLDYDERIFRVSASIGVVPIDDSMNSASKLLTQADNACYDRKRRGRRGFSVNLMQSKTALIEDPHAQSIDVQRCLEENSFTLYAQPIVHTNRPSQIVGIEILLRHQSIEHGLKLPKHFAPQIERLGLHAVVDRWVLKKTITWMRSNRSYVDELDFVAINLTPSSLLHRGFIETAEAALASNPECAHKVCFELTEHERLNLHGDIRERLYHLRRLGCQFAIDDYGSGWHQLDQIRDLPVDMVKISGDLAKRMTDDLVDRTVVRSIHEISKLLRKKTVLEQVSNEVMVADAREIGIDLCQGRFLAVESPLDSFRPRVSTLGKKI